MAKLAENSQEIKSKIRFDDLFREIYPDHYQGRSSLCPFHEDSRNSFEVHEDHGFCHTGCTPPGNGAKSFDVFSLWMKAKDVSFKRAVKDLSERDGVGPGNGKLASPNRAARRRTERSTETGAKARIVATYDYTDENGNILFQVVRFDPKDFRQRRPDGKGGWVWNSKDTRRVPYRLPEVLQADTVWLCEGEKDADKLAALDLCGTTAPLGAGKWPKLCKEHCIHEWFRGKHAIICADNDDAGRKDAQDKARSLYEIAASIKILYFSDLPEKGDVSDWIEQCSGPPEWALDELAAATPEWTPEPEKAKGEEKTKDKKPTKGQVLLELLDSLDIEYFSDQFSSPWACVPRDGHHENLRIKGQSFRIFLTGLFFDATAEGCGREIIQQIQDICIAKAYKGPQKKLSCRVAWQEGKIVIDTGAPDWGAFEVSAEGWKIVKLESPPFQRFSHMKMLPEPTPGGSISDIFRVAPVVDETSRILFTVWLVTMWIPDIPRYALTLAGLQGSGKTLFSELIRALIDPSQHATLSLPKDLNELVQTLAHNYLPIFDNLTRLPAWASDVLCRAVTGAGFSKRELFSDDDDICYSFFRSFVINGISVCAHKPDILDRVLICELERIKKEDRKSFKGLMAEFDEIQPFVLGAMLEALAGAMRLKDTIKLESLERMADWQEWGAAIAEATGIGQEAFLEALGNNVDRQNLEVNSEDPTAISVLLFMEDKTAWEGSPSELYKLLEKIAEDSGLDKELTWPKASNIFSRRIKAVSHNLAQAGLEVIGPRPAGHKNTKKVTLRKTTQKVGGEGAQNVIPADFGRDKPSLPWQETEPIQDDINLEYP